MKLRWLLSLVLAVLVTISIALTVIYSIGAWMRLTSRFPIAPQWLEAIDLVMLVALFGFAVRMLYLRWWARRARVNGSNKK